MNSSSSRSDLRTAQKDSVAGGDAGTVAHGGCRGSRACSFPRSAPCLVTPDGATSTAVAARPHRRPTGAMLSRVLQQGKSQHRVTATPHPAGGQLSTKVHPELSTNPAAVPPRRHYGRVPRAEHGSVSQLPRKRLGRNNKYLFSPSKQKAALSAAAPSVPSKLLRAGKVSWVSIPHPSASLCLCNR